MGDEAVESAAIMKLWLDDVRKPPDETWTWCKSVADAERAAHSCPDELALDFDLGGQAAHYGRGPYDHTARTGIELVRSFLEENWLPQRITIHSTNFGGVMQFVAELYQASVQLQQDIEIIVRPMRGRIMDRTPYYEPANSESR